jgi:hypothetical protein
MLNKLEKQFLQRLKEEPVLGEKLQKLWKKYETHLRKEASQESEALRKLQALLACHRLFVPLQKSELQILLGALKQNRAILEPHRANTRWKRWWAALYRALKWVGTLFTKKPNKKETFFKTTGHIWCDTIEHLATHALLWDKKETSDRPTTNLESSPKPKIFSPSPLK